MMGKENRLSRRSLLKGLAGIPLVGGVLIGALAESSSKQRKKEVILEALDIQPSPPPKAGSMSGDTIKIGIIGFGGRGEHLCRAAGHATDHWINNASNGAINAFKEQENLNTQITAVCDLFTPRAERATTLGTKTKRFSSYKELLEEGNIDAVIIATVDHWHAPIAIAALDAGKHVYVEKPMTHNIVETYALREAVRRNTNTVFAVGHQHRQTQSFLTAQDIIQKEILGHISLIQVNTNRNSDNGAWQYTIPNEASPDTIDWKQFLGDAPNRPFNAEHFFRWRKWWAYGSGLSGDLMTHDYDRINCVLNMGIPKYVTASGGIYTHRDGRNVPDVYQVNMEYPELITGNKTKTKGMTLVYSATLGNQHNRKTLLMGTDASMELGNSLTIYADPASKRFQKMMENEIIKGGEPIYSYDPADNNVDGITSATSQYFADKGLLWTYRDGKRVDSTFLHIKEWLSCIRNGGTPSCGIDEGFEEAITAHMAGLAYKTGRRMEWDAYKEEIIALPGENLDEILLTDTNDIYHGAMHGDRVSEIM